jgi:hypothetical protein
MKFLKFWFLTVLIISFNNLSAQDFAKKNIWEIGGRINYSSTTSVNNGETSENSLNVFSLHVPVYYFVIDGLSAGFIPGYENLSLGSSSASQLVLMAGLAYNIKTESAAYPYIEGRIGYNTSSNGNTRSGLIWLIAGGVKVQVGGNALINIGLAYEQSTLETSGSEGGRDGTNAWGIDAGFAVFFGN